MLVDQRELLLGSVDDCFLYINGELNPLAALVRAEVVFLENGVARVVDEANFVLGLIDDEDALLQIVEQLIVTASQDFCLDVQFSGPGNEDVDDQAGDERVYQQYNVSRDYLAVDGVIVNEVRHGNVYVCLLDENGEHVGPEVVRHCYEVDHVGQLHIVHEVVASLGWHRHSQRCVHQLVVNCVLADGWIID